MNLQFKGVHIVSLQDMAALGVRRFPIPPGAQAVWLFDVDQALKTHSAHAKAKAGDWQSALTLVSDVALAGIHAQRDKFGSDCIFVATFAREANYIQSKGGIVHGVFVLVNSGRSKSLSPDKHPKHWKRGMDMNSSKSLASQSMPSQPTRPATLSGSARLTTSEIDSLRQSKKLISAYVQKEFQASLGDKLALLKRQA